MPQIFKFHYKLFRASNAFLEGTKATYRTALAVFQTDSDITECNKGAGTQCMESIRQDYNVQNATAYYVGDLNLRISMANINSGNGGEVAECNKIITAVIPRRIPELSRDKCAGGLIKITGGSKCKDFTYNPALIESMQCILHDNLSGRLERTRYRSYAKVDDKYNSDKNAEAYPALDKFEF